MSLGIRGDENDRIKYANNKELLTDFDFKKWTKQKLPCGSTGFYITDFDAVIRSKAGGLSILEIKRQNASMPTAQNVTMQAIEKLIQAGAEALGYKVDVNINGSNVTIPVSFSGCHLLQLSNGLFENSELTFDGVQMSEQELIDILSFKRVI